MGLHSRYGWSHIYRQYENQKQLKEQYGVNILAYNQNVGNGILPDDHDEATKCCNTKSGLTKWIWDGKNRACTQFNKGGYLKIYTDPKFEMEIFTYLHEECTKQNYPEFYHCVGEDLNHGWGVPKNGDGWWNQMLLGFVKCAMEAKPDRKWFHIWNEPDSNWHRYGFGKDGDDYALFYYQTAKAIKDTLSKKYPNIKLSGPVTWQSPLRRNTFQDWITPLMKKIVAVNRKDLLDYIDFHAYTYTGDRYSPWARWDLMVSSIHVISLYYNGLTNGASWIRSMMTETNVALNDVEVKNKWTYWVRRVIENGKQIMALTHNTDKFNMRIQYTMGEGEGDVTPSNHYGWLPGSDKFMQDVIKPLQNGYPVNFTFDWVKTGFPRYDNGYGIMAQTVYNKAASTITVVLINYGTLSKAVTLNDVNNKITWKKGRWTQGGTPKTFTPKISGSKATVTLKQKTITAITGVYKTKPWNTLREYEFGPMDESKIMTHAGSKTNKIDFTVNINVFKWKISKINPKYAFIKFGLGYGAVTDFKWNVKVIIGTTTYWVKSNYKANMNYTEFAVGTKPFLNKIKSGNFVKIQLVGNRIAFPGVSKQPYPYPGRIDFVSLVVGGYSSGSAYTEDDSGMSTINTTEYVAISTISGIIMIAVIGLCIFCAIKKRKMKNAVSFAEAKEIDDFEQDGDGQIEDNDNIYNKGGYDMSPIDTTITTQGNQIENEEDEKDEEDQEEEDEIEVEFELDVNQ